MRLCRTNATGKGRDRSTRRLSQGEGSDADRRSSRLTRSKSDPSSGRAEARRARANAMVDGDAVSLKVSKPPALKRQDASRDVKHAHPRKTIITRGKQVPQLVL